MAAIVSVDTTHFTLDDRTLPRVFFVEAHSNGGAQIVHEITQQIIAVPLGSTVDGDTPADQEDLIAALAAVVMP